MLLFLFGIKHFKVKLLDAEAVGVWLVVPLVGDDGVDLLHSGPGWRMTEHGVVLDVIRCHAGGGRGSSSGSENFNQGSLVSAEMFEG